MPQAWANESRAQPRVLRLCSVFEPHADRADMADWRFDPVGGMQTHTGALTRQLDRRGLAQDVITSRLARRYEVERIGDHARVARLGVRMRRLRQLWALAAVGRVLVHRGAYDLVHAHQGEDLALLLLGQLAAWWHRCPWVVTVHCSLACTYRADGLRQQLIKAYGGWLERRLLPRAHAVITLTDLAAEHLAAGGVDTAALRVIPSGVDVSAYRRPHPDPFADIGRPRVVYIGRLAPQKSVHTLIDAFARLQHPQARLMIVGDGPDRAALEALAARRGLGGRVTFTGFLTRLVIPGVLRYTDVLVLPSRCEELGSVLLEGLAAGVPIVASRVGGIPSVIDHGHSGLLVPPGDAEALAHCMGDVLGRPALAARLADGARSQADRYDWERLASEVLEVYRTAADRWARRSRIRRVTA